MAYTGLFLSGKVLEWFKPYFTKIQENGLTTTNQKVRYIFLLERALEWFKPYFTKIQENGLTTVN